MPATAIMGCGCSHTIYEGFGCVDYRRCAQHYRPGDNAKILDAAANQRRWDESLANLQKTKFWNGVYWEEKAKK